MSARPSTLGAIVLTAMCLSGAVAGVRPQMAERSEGSGPATTGDSINPRAPSLERLEAQVRSRQIRTDFERLRALRDEIDRRVVAGGPLDYERIAKQTGEINKRARHLKTWLALGYGQPGDDFAKAAEVGAGDLPAALVTLRDRLDSFLREPVFESRGLVDVQKATQAAADLRAIVAMSAVVQRSANRLKRAPR